MSGEKYVLATGDEGASRLGNVNSVHGTDTWDFFRRIRIPTRRTVADIGCGTGMVSCTLANQFVPYGKVVGVDVSAAQVTYAQGLAGALGATNARFVTASAYETGLEPEGFGMVYSRFLLMHLERPAQALREMARLLRPRGVLAIEDGDFASPFCWPPSAAYDRCFELYRQVGAHQGADFEIGSKLAGLIKAAGFSIVEVRLAQPIIGAGEIKRLPEKTLLESAPAILEAGLATQTEIDDLARELAILAADEDTLFGMARMTQVFAKK